MIICTKHYYAMKYGDEGEGCLSKTALGTGLGAPKIAEPGAGEMAQQLRALPTLPGSIPSTHMAAHNCL